MNQYTNIRPGLTLAAPRITWAVQKLILLNVAVFALQTLARPLEIYFLPDFLLEIVPISKLLSKWFGFQPEWFLGGMLWTPFTYMFLHAGLLHLFMNMLWLFFFGPEVERTLGTRQFFRFYFFCGAAGVMATFFPYALFGVRPLVMGASGAVMGAMIAFAILEPDRQFFLFPLPVPINTRALVLIVVVLNIVSGLGEGGRVSVATHFGGMTAGYLYMRFRPALSRWDLDRRRAKLARTTLRKDQPATKEPPQNSAAGPSDNDRLGEEIDRIFSGRNRDRFEE